MKTMLFVHKFLLFIDKYFYQIACAILLLFTMLSLLNMGSMSRELVEKDKKIELRNKYIRQLEQIVERDYGTVEDVIDVDNYDCNL